MASKNFDCLSSLPSPHPSFSSIWTLCFPINANFMPLEESEDRITTVNSAKLNSTRQHTPCPGSVVTPAFHSDPVTCGLLQRKNRVCTCQCGAALVHLPGDSASLVGESQRGLQVQQIIVSINCPKHRVQVIAICEVD